jgi:outer membrane immunogenic protein
MKKQFVAGLFAAAMMTPAAALAQDSNETETFIGVSAGYHDLGIGSDEAEGFDIDDASPIFGVVAGVVFPIGGDLFAGVEGNFHFGTDAVDYEYGALARFGIVD